MSLTQTQVESAKNVACEKCSCEVMKQAFVIKMVSGLLMQDGKDTYVPVPIFACNDCGHVNSVFVKDLKIKTKETTKESVLHVPV
jgi:uncharacterized Zn finger protein